MVSGICWARSRLHTCVEKLLPRAQLQAMASAERKGSGGDEGYLRTPLTPDDLPEATEEELPEPVRLLPQGLCRVFSVHSADHSNQVQQASQNESDFLSVIRCVAAPLQSVAWGKEVLYRRNQSGRVLPGFVGGRGPKGEIPFAGRRKPRGRRRLWGQGTPPPTMLPTPSAPAGMTTIQGRQPAAAAAAAAAAVRREAAAAPLASRAPRVALQALQMLSSPRWPTTPSPSGPVPRQQLSV